MARFSALGRARIAALVLLLLLDFVVVVLSGRVNSFQNFFFVADLMPFAFSVITLFLLLIVIAFDLSTSSNNVIARPAFNLGWMFVFTVLWLAFNVFSTARWSDIQSSTCASIPAGLDAEKTWCAEIQALRGLIWVEWVILLILFLSILRYVHHEHSQGRRQIWRTALSSYDPVDAEFNDLIGNMGTRSSEFLQYGKFD